MSLTFFDQAFIASLSPAEADPILAIPGLELRYDPRSRLYVDAGTALADDGDDVAQADNRKTSNELVQATSGSRPARQDIDDLRTLRFELGDSLGFSTLDFGTDDFYASFGLVIDSGYSDFIPLRGASTTIGLRNTDALIFTAAGLSWYSPGAIPSGPHYFEFELVAGELTFRIDGVDHGSAYFIGPPLPAFELNQLGGNMASSYVALTVIRGAISSDDRAMLRANDMSLLGL